MNWINRFIPIFALLFILSASKAQDAKPNVLFIIADDLGIDAINGFGLNTSNASTPNIDALRANGLTYTNTWSSPQCTPTRAGIMSGKYGIKTGVMRPPGNLDLVHESIFDFIDNNAAEDYATAVIGKWHISNPLDYNHPEQHGIDHYEGLFTSSVSDYYSWDKVADGQLVTVEEYVTTNLTDAAISWVADQDQPWFLWLAHVAPHSPFHLPPEGLYNVDNPTSNSELYQAAIEAMDSEIGRLLDNIDQDQLENTVIIFIGDNGTPNGVLNYYPSGHGKSTLYEGGIRVPMVISGKGVSRVSETETGLTQVIDLYATIAELTSIPLNGGINNSFSLKPSLSCEGVIERNYIYSDYEDDGIMQWTIKNDQYKLIKDENGNIEFYDLIDDPLEEINLALGLTPDQAMVMSEMEVESEVIRSDWSCVDGIQNGLESTIDDCNNQCTEIDVLSTENTGCCVIPDEPSAYYEYIENNSRFIYSNGFPNHEYCHTSMNVPEPMYHLFGIEASPMLSNSITQLVSNSGRPARYFGVAKNGVIFAPAPATPFIFENENTGEYNWDWVFEPTNNQGDGRDLVALDCASAHTGPQGYHYHGEMFEYLEGISPGITTSTISTSIIHIGWASDGFPILYKFGPDANGNIRELLASFQLKSGLRPGDGIEEPCGPYSGKYTNDYEFICGKGDLDECNGIASSVMVETPEGQVDFNYFYVITSSFPQIPRCLVGNISEDFDNGQPSLTGVDNDGDGFLEEFDCDDTDPDINPMAEEIPDNAIDEDCDGDILLNNSELVDIGYELWPNPNLGEFELRSKEGKQFGIELINSSGVLVRTEKGNGTIKLSNIKTGYYSIRINQDGATVGHGGVVVQ